MRIGIEGRTLQQERYGVARYLLNLLREWIKIDSGDQFVVYLSKPIELLEFSAPNLEYKVIPLPRFLPSVAWRHFLLPLSMWKDKVDLHFSPSYFLPLFQVCPCVVVVHDITFRVHPEWFIMDRRFRYDKIFWGKVRKADRIITVSEHSKSDIVNYLDVDPEKVIVIYEAADERFCPVEDRESLKGVRVKYGLEENFIFTIGSIHTRRNLERLIEALCMVKGKLGKVPVLLIVGIPAPFSPPVDIQEIARSCGLEKRVVHIPYVPEEDLLLLYNACDFFVYPSLYEGFGLPVIEAMACGKPVACSRATSLPEVAGEAALYFDPLDTESMAEAIEKLLLDDKLRGELGRAGLRRASSFSWRRAAKETLEVFREVAG